MRFIKFFLLLVVAVLSGCASGAVSSNMVSSDVQVANKHPYSVSVVVDGGKDTNPMWASQISNPEFQSAIAETLAKSGVFRTIIKDGNSDYLLEVNITALQQPVFGINFTVSMSTNWKLTSVKDKKPVMEQVIESSYTAGMGDSVVGVKRLRIANEGAARENIKEGASKLSAIRLP